MNKYLVKTRFYINHFGTRITNKNFWFILLADCIAVIAAIIISYSIRFEFTLLPQQWNQILILIPISLLFRIPVFYAFKLYSGMWRYTSLTDILAILKAVILSSLLLTAFLLFENRFVGYSRAVLLIDAILVFLFLCGIRVSIRWVLRDVLLLRKNKKLNKKRLLIIGAGAAAEKVVREIEDNKTIHYKIVGFIDDNSTTWGAKVHGYPVLGGVNDLIELAQLTKAEELLIAIPSAIGKDIRRITAECRKTNLTFKALPSIGEIIQGKESSSSIRDLDYKDLLRRPLVHLNHEVIDEYLGGKTILITGAGGSIGSELCRQVINFKPKHLILYDAGEENLYSIQMQLEHELRFTDYSAILGNCTNISLLKKIFSDHQPEVVFHAAAYKHVPLVETNPWEGIINNVVAFKNLFEVAHQNRTTEKFVLVSSDKAVRPTNVMGASKRLTELIMHAYCKDNKLFRKEKMACMAVRFGNVLGSSGSVIPLFRKQIEKGGPVTVTDPKINRYFMAIEEAAQLILQAGAMGGEGEIFLLEMGKPVLIKELAEDLIQLMGYTPYEDIDIVFTGLRPGEKLYEELITEGEGVVQTNHEKIMVLKCEAVSLIKFDKRLKDLIGAAEKYQGEQVKKIMSEIIPEYQPSTQ